jgi:hypothetical protein
MARRLCRLFAFLLPLIFLVIAAPAGAQGGVQVGAIIFL